GKILASGSADNSIKIWPLLSQTIYSRKSTPKSKPVRSRKSTPQSKPVSSRTSTSKSKAFFKPSILVRNKQRNQGFWSVIFLFCLLGFSYFLTVANNNKNNQTPNFPIEEIPGGSIL
ncbi:WD40 repeat domain-containing protein, partial [Anabaena sp. PCC 7938]